MHTGRMLPLRQTSVRASLDRSQVHKIVSGPDVQCQCSHRITHSKLSFPVLLQYHSNWRRSEFLHCNSCKSVERVSHLLSQLKNPLEFILPNPFHYIDWETEVLLAWKRKVATWINLKDIMWSKRSQTQKTIWLPCNVIIQINK